MVIAPSMVVVSVGDLKGSFVGYYSYQSKVYILVFWVLIACGVYPGSCLACCPKVARFPALVPSLVKGPALLLPLHAARSVILVVAEYACGF